MRSTGIEYPARGEMAFVDLGSPPDPKDTEILIRTCFSGITNGTERHALMAEHLWGQFPSRHGYQHVGVVEKAGREVKEFAEGDWVFFGHYVGHRAWNVIDVASPLALHSGNHLTVRLPAREDPLQYSEYALLGVAGVAMRGARRFRVGPAQNVWVAGLGPIGQYAAQACRALGAAVTVTDVNQERLDTASAAGAHKALNVSGTRSESHSSADADAAIKQGAPYDAIIDCSGYPPFVRELFEKHLLKHGGVVGLLAVRTDTVFHWSMLHMTEASIEVSCHFSVNDLKALLRFMQDRVILNEPLIKDYISIDRAPEIYATMRDRPADLLGVVFDWR
jgi:2-desacetyl-2-hydroxyethyl bacteriochlorophyllide A dehydrogenase